MLQEVETQTLMLTPAASQAVQDILAERNLKGYALRVYVAGGGCCGVNFGMALDNNIRDEDMTLESNGVQLVVDNASMDYLRGATIDYVNDPQQGQGFAVNSPSVMAHNHEDGEQCACGGSCSCNN